MPANFAVTNLDNDGAGSLRQAIVDANADVNEPHNIDFQAGLEGTVTLATALDALGRNMSINGLSRNVITVQRDTAAGTPAFRIFSISDGKTVTIKNLVVSNGLASGLINSGGGILNLGTLTLEGVRVENNNATGANSKGGGIANLASLDLKSSFDDDAEFKTTIRANTSAHQGGGIWNGDGANLQDRLDAQGRGGSQITGGNTATGNLGGGIYNIGSINLRKTLVAGNFGTSGAGIFNGEAATAFLTDARVNNNQATVNEGGGIFSLGGLTISGTEVSGNQAATRGGGISNHGGLLMTNTTVSGNAAINRGGGLYQNGNLNPLSRNFTITNNQAKVNPNSGALGPTGGGEPAVGGGVYVEKGSTFPLANAIIAGNVADVAPDVFGEFESAGHNLIGNIGSLDEPFAYGFNEELGDLVGTEEEVIDAMLSPLDFYGGDTRTHLLLPGSPALDMGDNDYAAVPVDQRGFERIVDATGLGEAIVDIGAVEMQPVYASVGDFVFQDLNSNGLQDEGEPGVADVFVDLIAVDSSYFASAVTDESGNYLFTDVPPGDYYLQFYLPEGYLFTQPYQGDPALDSDADPVGGTTAVFTLLPGQVDPTFDAGLIATASGQWASTATASSEWNPSPGDWSAAQVIGEPNVEAYGDSPLAWAALNADEGIQTLTVGFDTPVYATGVTVRENYGNGFVVQIDLLDESGAVVETIWDAATYGPDPSQPGSLADFVITFPATTYLVQGVIIYVNTDHNPGDWEEIDAVMLHGDAGGGFAALSTGGADGAGGRVRVSSVRRPNRGPVATLRASGPVTLGVPVTLLFSNPRDRWRPVPASAFRYSFDFNNDGDFTDVGEVLNGTSTSAQHTFTRRGWQVIHGRVRSLDGRYTDFWLRVFVG